MAISHMTTPSAVIAKHLASRFHGHDFDGVAGLIVRRDKRFNFLAQLGITCTGLPQKCETLRRVSFKCGLENLF